MSTPKLQVGRALAVLPSDNSNIPFPGSGKITGTNTTATANKLVVASALFLSNGTKAGDIVYNNTDGTSATITAIDSNTTVSLNANIFTATIKVFTIYQTSDQSGLGNQPCVLYVGGTGNLAVVTAGDDSVTLVGVPAGSFIPLNVKKILSTGTTATSILGLW